MNTTEQSETSPLPPERKLQFASQVFAQIENLSSVVVSGSLSAVIAEHVNPQEQCVVEASDLVMVHDIDLAVIGFDQTPELDHLIEEMNKTSFGLERHPILQSSIYDLRIQKILVSECRVIIAQKSYSIRYTTPAFLLLSLLDQEITEKTTKGKMRAKILRIQKIKGFSIQDFKTAAEYELSQRIAMNRNTFNRIVNNLQYEKRDPLITNLSTPSQIWEKYESLFDEVEFHNKIHTIDDLEHIDFNEIRKISNLEKFVVELS